MKLDFATFAFGYHVLEGGCTPNWATSLGQGKEYKINDSAAINELLKGMIYSSVPLGKISTKIGKGGKMVSGDEPGTPIVLASLFSKVYLNNDLLDNGKFILLITRDDSASHTGRLRLKYGPSNTYHSESDSFSNQNFIDEVRRYLSLAHDACWFVYNIEIINQNELHLFAVVVDENRTIDYSDTRSMHNAWESLIPDILNEENEASGGSIEGRRQINIPSELMQNFDTYLAAIRTKPFILLAGISGTGKSRLVRQLAKATAGEMADDQKPGNFELIPVKPNWHDSTELLGYVSRISGEPKFVMTNFVRFLFKASLFPTIPFFLCLDEMNLAPVEQFFAEYLSVIETRKKTEEGSISTDVLVPFDAQLYNSSIKEELKAYFESLNLDEDFEEVSRRIMADGGLRIPSNLVVIGTVNMDETTFSFSRKVLDRAMSFELNEVDMDEGLTTDNSSLPEIPTEAVMQSYLTANEAYEANANVANAVIARLKQINAALDETPFKIAYRSRNEILIYIMERMREYLIVNKPDAEEVMRNALFHQAMDEAVSMKILSRIEGDEQKVSKDFLEKLQNAIFGDIAIEQSSADTENEEQLTDSTVSKKYIDERAYPICKAKIKQMTKQLAHGYVSFWS